MTSRPTSKLLIISRRKTKVVYVVQLQIHLNIKIRPVQIVKNTFTLIIITKIIITTTTTTSTITTTTTPTIATITHTITHTITATMKTAGERTTNHTSMTHRENKCAAANVVASATWVRTAASNERETHRVTTW